MLSENHPKATKVKGHTTVPIKVPTKAPVKALPDSSRHLLERKLGHIFRDPNLLWEALQAAGNGVVQSGDRKIDDGNKKMALLGDSIIRLALLNEWYGSGKSRKLGHDLSTSIGNNRNLDKCGRQAGLEALINPNRAFLKGGRDIPPKTMSATVEALIGAVWVDSGESLRAVKSAMRGLGLLMVQDE